MNDPVRYIITTHRHLPGVRLSKCGHWLNEPFPNATQGVTLYTIGEHFDDIVAAILGRPVR
jgi:hypothetical protein